MILSKKNKGGEAAMAMSVYEFVEKVPEIFSQRLGEKLWAPSPAALKKFARTFKSNFKPEMPTMSKLLKDLQIRDEWTPEALVEAAIDYLDSQKYVIPVYMDAGTLNGDDAKAAFCIGLLEQVINLCGLKPVQQLDPRIPPPEGPFVSNLHLDIGFIAMELGQMRGRGEKELRSDAIERITANLPNSLIDVHHYIKSQEQPGPGQTA